MIRTLLVVDDDDYIREVASVALGAIGEFRVVTASNGVDAVRIAVAEQPDAILLDVMMPSVDGPMTLDALRADARSCDIPVAFFTAIGNAAEQAAMMDLGVRGVISKPFDPLALPNEVRTIFGWGR